MPRKITDLLPQKLTRGDVFTVPLDDSSSVRLHGGVVPCGHDFASGGLRLGIEFGRYVVVRWAGEDHGDFFFQLSV